MVSQLYGKQSSMVPHQDTTFFNFIIQVWILRIHIPFKLEPSTIINYLQEYSCNHLCCSPNNVHAFTANCEWGDFPGSHHQLFQCQWSLSCWKSWYACCELPLSTSYLPCRNRAVIIKNKEWTSKATMQWGCSRDLRLSSINNDRIRNDLS